MNHDCILLQILTDVIEDMGGTLVALEGFVSGHKDGAGAQRKCRIGNRILLQQTIELQA